MSLTSETPSLDPSIEHLSPSIFLHKPNSPAIKNGSASTTTIEAPNLILLFSWTGAQQKYITKYISGYNALFPSTSVMVITTAINDLVYRTSKKRRSSFIPAITAITSSADLNRNILLHAFSEGGSSTSVHFAKAYRTHTRRRLPLVALVLDSCPGTLRFTNLAHAVRNSVSGNPAAQVAASLTAYTVIASYWTTLMLIGGREDVDDSKDLFAKTKVALNDNSLWNSEAPRAYLFSKADKLIDWKSVLEHAQRSERRGTPVVAVEAFEKTAHCAHIREKDDAERYWSAVQKVWDAKVNGASDLVEWGVGEEKKDKVDVRVQEVGVPAKRPVVKRCTCSDCGR
jgi:hypothetical protein